MSHRLEREVRTGLLLLMGEHRTARGMTRKGGEKGYRRKREKCQSHEEKTSI